MPDAKRTCDSAAEYAAAGGCGAARVRDSAVLRVNEAKSDDQ